MNKNLKHCLRTCKNIFEADQAAAVRREKEPEMNAANGLGRIAAHAYTLHKGSPVALANSVGLPRFLWILAFFPVRQNF